MRLAAITNTEEMKSGIEREFEDMILYLTNIDVKIKKVMKHNPDAFNESALKNVSFAAIITSLL